MIAATPASAPVASPPAGGAARETPPGRRAGAGTAALTGADMSLSESGETLARPWGAGSARGAAIAALHAVPALLALAAWWLARTRASRGRRREVRAAFRALELALGSGAPARDAGPVIAAAVRRLAAATGADRGDAAAALGRLETRAFDPAAAGDRVAADVVDELRAVARAWTGGEARRPGALAPATGTAKGAAVLVVAAAMAGSATTAAADGPPPPALAEARALYAQALDATDRGHRVRLFGAAERAFRPIARDHPDAPGIQADWGNAALGAEDAGRAVLAFRRALGAAPDDARARTNLDWLRARMPAWLPRPGAVAAWDSLVFWRGLLNPGQLQLVGAGAFAVFLLALARRLLGRPRPFAALAAPALVVWAVAVATAWTSRPDPGDAVVLADGASVRSADAAGAPLALPRPLPAGTEVSIVEIRDAWARVRLADGASGWLAASAVERVTPAPP